MDTIVEESVAVHPYTYLPTKVIRYRNDEGQQKIRWFHLLNNEELPPFFGYGQGVQEKVDNWYNINYSKEKC